MSDSVQPHRRQHTRLPSPWDSQGKNTGVGCHFLLQCVKVKSESEVTQSCPTPRDPMDCNLLGSSVHGIFKARVLEWGSPFVYKVTIHWMHLYLHQLLFGRWSWLKKTSFSGSIHSPISDWKHLWNTVADEWCWNSLYAKISWVSLCQNWWTHPFSAIQPSSRYCCES